MNRGREIGFCDPKNSIEYVKEVEEEENQQYTHLSIHLCMHKALTVKMYVNDFIYR